MTQYRYLLYMVQYMEERETFEPDATEMGTSGRIVRLEKCFFIVTRWPSTPHKPRNKINELNNTHICEYALTRFRKVFKMCYTDYNR